MALISHQTQVSFSSHSLRPKTLNDREKWKSSKCLQVIYRIDDLAPLKLKFRCQPQSFHSAKRSFKVSSFKDNTQNDEPQGKGGLKSLKSSFHISHGLGREEKNSETYDAKNNSLSFGSEEKEENPGKSIAIKRLFLKWLLMLRTQSSNQTKDENYSEVTPNNTSLEAQGAPLETKEASMLMISALAFFLRLDVTISIPVLLFVPGYLTVRVIYGAAVTKELMPLWLLGPVIISLYVKIIQGLCWLYVFLFAQSINLAKNLPAYSLLVYSFIMDRKFKELLWTIFCKPFIDIRNLDYGAFCKQKYKQLEVWAIEKYLDYVESIWPYYCRTIRFLKKAHLL